MSEVEEDLKATAEAITADARRLVAIEEEKQDLPPEDPLVPVLSAEAQRDQQAPGDPDGGGGRARHGPRRRGEELASDRLFGRPQRVPRRVGRAGRRRPAWRSTRSEPGHLRPAGRHCASRAGGGCRRLSRARWNPTRPTAMRSRNGRHHMSRTPGRPDRTDGRRPGSPPPSPRADSPPARQAGWCRDRDAGVASDRGRTNCSRMRRSSTSVRTSASNGARSATASRPGRVGANDCVRCEAQVDTTTRSSPVPWPESTRTMRPRHRPGPRTALPCPAGGGPGRATHRRVGTW